MTRTDRTRWTDSVLLALLLLLLLGAVTFDRTSWPGLVGDEATYLVQAESLAFDGDLVYHRADYDRFVAHWGQPPEGLILQSGDGGRRITFGKPFFYAGFLAPFVRLSPTRGPFVANVLVLAATALLVARRLRPRLGPAAPLWVASWIFGSVAFAYVFWAHSDLLLLCCTAVAFALVVEPPEGESVRGWRWLAAGALLAVVAFSRPTYAPLFLPALVALGELPRSARLRCGAVLVTAFVAAIALAAAVHVAHAGSLTGYGAERHGFYRSTGFPEVDFPASGWTETMDRLQNNAWRTGIANLLREKKVVPSLWAADIASFLRGRDVGVLPYYTPLLLGLLAAPRGRVRIALLVAVALSVAAFFYLRPFNFWGGGGAIANRYFLPLYPALWFLPTQRRGVVPVLVVTALAAPFLYPTWTSPRAYPLTAANGYRWVSPVATAVLPTETSQSHLKPGGRDDVVHGALWLRFVTPGIGYDAGRDELSLGTGEKAEVLLGSPQPLAGLVVDLAPGSTDLVVTGAARGTAVSGTTPLALGGPSAVHPMWWTWDAFYLYDLRLEVAARGGSGTATFRFRPASAEAPR